MADLEPVDPRSPREVLVRLIGRFQSWSRVCFGVAIPFLTLGLPLMRANIYAAGGMCVFFGFSFMAGAFFLNAKKREIEKMLA